MSRIFKTPLKIPLITTALIALIVAGGLIYQRVHYSTVVSPQVVTDAESQGQVNVEVQLDFAPEAFNVNYLQQYANAVAVQDTSALLFGVTPSGLQAVGGQHWVQAIVPIGTSQ